MRKTDLASITFILASLFAESTANDRAWQEQPTIETTEIQANNLCNYEVQELRTSFGQYKRVINQPCIYQLPHENQKVNTLYNI